MIEVHIEDRWDWMRKDVYILHRLEEGLYLSDPDGNMNRIEPGTRVTDKCPTFVIKQEWEEQFIEKLDPMIDRATEETSMSLWIERGRVDKMLNYLIGYEDGN